jgi:hypothetical protein
MLMTIEDVPALCGIAEDLDHTLHGPPGPSVQRVAGFAVVFKRTTMDCGAVLALKIIVCWTSQRGPAGRRAAVGGAAGQRSGWSGGVVREAEGFLAVQLVGGLARPSLKTASIE